MEKISFTIEYKGKDCFHIRLDLRDQIQKIKLGEIIKVISDNPKSEISLPKWLRENKQELFLSDNKNGSFIFYIKRRS